MHKRTVVDQIEISQGGAIGIRLGKEVVDYDGSVISRSWHRTAIQPGGDVISQMEAVNAHLSSMNCEQVSASDIDRIRFVSETVWAELPVAPS